MNIELTKLADFSDWVRNTLSLINEEVWFRPMGEDKWSIHQTVCHLYFWDQYSVEVMIPAMKDKAKLDFIEIQSLNDRAEEYSFTVDKETLVKKFEDTRYAFIKLMEEKLDEALSFYLENKESGPAGYLHIFTHHDEHHRKQIEAFLKAEGIQR